MDAVADVRVRRALARPTDDPVEGAGGDDGRFEGAGAVAALAVGLAYARVEPRLAADELAASGQPALLSEAHDHVAGLVRHSPSVRAHAHQLLDAALAAVPGDRATARTGAEYGRAPGCAMTSSKRAELLAEFAVANGREDTGEVVRRLAVACARLSDGWQAAVEVRQPGHAAVLQGMSSSLAETAADIEFTLGQGPARDALVSHRPVLVVDAGTDPRWPQTGPRLAEVGVGSVAALPLQVGAVTFGTLTLYHERQVTFERSLVGGIVEVASALTDVLLDLLASGGDPLAGPVAAAAAPTAVVHQATGMVAVQLGCDVAEALARLRAYAYGQGQPLASVASAVVGGALRLTP